MTLEDETNWYRYARFINDEAAHLRLKTETSKDIKSTSSDVYLTLAKSLSNSRLDNRKIKKPSC